jgi:hypothetical protein
VNHLGETLRQTRLSMALIGDESIHTGMSRSLHYRWFTDSAARSIYPEDDHTAHSRLIAANLHHAYTRDSSDPRATAIVDSLLARSPEFTGLWREHPITGPYCPPKRIRHPQLGLLELHCQTLIDPEQTQMLVVYTASPGTESHEKLQLLSVIGEHHH